MTQRVKARTFEILEVAKPGDRGSAAFDVFIMALISLNVIAVILETVESLSARFGPLFSVFEVFSVIVFTIEYLLRVWSCGVSEKYRHPVTGRIRFAFTPMPLIDLLAILPFYLPMLIPLDLRFIRALRLFRLFRLLKIGRYADSVKTLGALLKAKKEELSITVFTIVLLLVLASSLMYFVENEAQPQAFSSIPAAMWWGVATLTTVGYGDVYPVTPLGKILGALIAILGIGIFALPAGIVASGLVEVIQKRRADGRTCPHCGKRIDEPPMKSPTTSP